MRRNYWFIIMFTLFITYSLQAVQPEWVSVKNRSKAKPNKEVKENNSNKVSFDVEINGFEKKKRREK